jgi:NitT/TauT family transport system substrate-binding protein
VSDTFLKENPDVVRRFVAATVKGMEAAFADPAGAARMIKKYHPQVEPPLGQAETEVVRELAVTPLTRARGLGSIDPQKMEQTRDVVIEAFNLAKRLPIEDFYAPGFAGK